MGREGCGALALLFSALLASFESLVKTGLLVSQQTLSQATVRAMWVSSGVREAGLGRSFLHSLFKSVPWQFPKNAKGQVLFKRFYLKRQTSFMQWNPAGFYHSIWSSGVQKGKETDTAHLTAGPALAPLLNSTVPWSWRWTTFTDGMHRRGSAQCCWPMGTSLWLKKTWGYLLIMN